mgnify:CR=1 FL=1
MFQGIFYLTDTAYSSKGLFRYLISIFHFVFNVYMVYWLLRHGLVKFFWELVNCRVWIKIIRILLIIFFLFLCLFLLNEWGILHYKIILEHLQNYRIISNLWVFEGIFKNLLHLLLLRFWLVAELWFDGHWMNWHRTIRLIIGNLIIWHLFFDIDVSLLLRVFQMTVFLRKFWQLSIDQFSVTLITTNNLFLLWNRLSLFTW